MNGDLRLRRRRWWGAWAIGITALLCLLLWVPDLVEHLARGGEHRLREALPVGLGVALLLVCYAPWTFFPLVRACGVLLVVVAAWIAWDALAGTAAADDYEAGRLLRGAFLFGVPGALLALAHRPRTCPYDERGAPLQAAWQVRIEVPRPPDAEPRAWKRDLAGIARALVGAEGQRVHAAPHATPFGVTGLMVEYRRQQDRTAVLERAERLLEARGLAFSVQHTRRVPGTIAESLEGALRQAARFLPFRVRF